MRVLAFVVHFLLRAARPVRLGTILSRFCPAPDPRLSYLGEDLVQTLERVCAGAGGPKTIQVDNGNEFISRDLGLWA